MTRPVKTVVEGGRLRERGAGGLRWRGSGRRITVRGAQPLELDVAMLVEAMPRPPEFEANLDVATGEIEFWRTSGYSSTTPSLDAVPSVVSGAAVGRYPDVAASWERFQAERVLTEARPWLDPRISHPASSR